VYQTVFAPAVEVSIAVPPTLTMDAPETAAVGVVGTDYTEYNTNQIKYDLAGLSTILGFVHPTGTGQINIPDVANANETMALLSNIPDFTNVAFTNDIIKSQLVFNIPLNLIEPKTMYRITDATGGVVRVWGVSNNTISAAAFQEGSWDGTTLTGGAWGTYNLSTDTFTAISGGTLTAASFYTFIDSLSTIAAATVDNADYVSISDVSATLQKKISWSDFKIALKLSFDNTYQAILTATTMRTFVDSLTALTTPSDADRMLIVEDATSLAKKITYANIRAGINTNAIDLVTVKLSEAINKGQAVYISGANGTNILVSKASNASEATSSKTLGLLQTSGALNDIVNVVTSGLLDGLDTSTATVGDPVWLGTSGNLIFGLASKPVAPAHLVYIGVVSRVSATVGEIFVRVQNGFELKEIHDVLITSVADKDVLQYESATTLWKNKALTTASVAASTDKNYVTDAKLIVVNNTSGTNTGDQDLSTLMVKANNLSDLANTSTARTNLKISDVYITTGDQTTSSSTASSITGLSFSATASKRYKISGVIHIGCGSVGGVRIQATLPTGATVYLICTGLTSSATAILQAGIIASATLTGNAFCTIISSSGYIKVDGEIQLSSTAGTVQFGVASAVNLQTSTIFQLGTQLTITEI
jgi:hypothetical protein